MTGSCARYSKRLIVLQLMARDYERVFVYFWSKYMLEIPQDRLWDQLIRQVTGLSKDSIVEIIDYSSKQESVSDSSGERRTGRRVVKWPVQRPRRAAW